MLYKVGIIVDFMLIVCISGKLFAGPYDIVFRRFYHCNDLGENTWLYSTRISKINRTHLAYTGNFTIPHGVTDDMMIINEFSVFGNGGWRPNYFVAQLNRACSDTERLMPGFLKSLFGKAGLKNVSCPIPPGRYFIKNWLFDVNFGPKIVPYNKYRSTARLFEKGKLQTCVVLEADAVPKKE